MLQRNISNLLNTLPQIGKVTWIGLRPERRAPMEVVEHVETCPQKGLIGDRYSSRAGKRHVTLVQQEHLAVIASLLGIHECKPESLRRNIVVKEMNLLALKDKHFKIGQTILEFTGLCHPCSFMEEIFGTGGYNAIRGHGGITAKVIQGGNIQMSDPVSIYND